MCDSDAPTDFADVLNARWPIARFGSVYTHHVFTYQLRAKSRETQTTTTTRQTFSILNVGAYIELRACHSQKCEMPHSDSI